MTHPQASAVTRYHYDGVDYKTLDSALAASRRKLSDTAAVIVTEVSQLPKPMSSEDIRIGAALALVWAIENPDSFSKFMKKCQVEDIRLRYVFGAAAGPS